MAAPAYRHDDRSAPFVDEAPVRRMFTPDEYYRMGDAGVFDPEERVELIHGEIVKMAPIGPEHVFHTRRLSKVLGPLFSGQGDVREGQPLSLADSEPQPDIAIVPGDEFTYRAHHPSTAILVVEVSNTTLAFDRQAKADLYASAGIPEYWIVNVQDQCIEVHKEPQSSVTGARYGDIRTYTAQDRIVVADAELSVSNLLGQDRIAP